jgi:hypothetical protein
MSAILAELLNLLISKPDLANAIAAIASATVALLALIISVVSLYVAHTTLKHQRAHNVLSVRPLPMIAVGDYENNVFVKLRNDGPGPLIIQTLQVQAGAASKDSIIDWMPDLPVGVDWVTFVGPIPGRSISSGGELTLVELAGNKGNAVFLTARDAVRAALSRLEVAVKYTDVYGTSLSPYQKDLGWFARSTTYPDAARKR